MTKEQKNEVMQLRMEGLGYTRIANCLGVSVYTIKSYCRRNGLSSKNEEIQIRVAARYGKIKGVRYCKYCGTKVVQNPKRKEKKFCSDKCRNKWWNKHLDEVERKANYSFVCPQCKEPFIVYGNAKRKYCSHECYIRARFGK